MNIRGMYTGANFSDAQKARLQQIIHKNFNVQQFRTLCLDLGVPIHQLAGETHAQLIAALIDHLAEQNRLYKLLDYLQDKLPKQDIWHHVMRAPMVQTGPKRTRRRWRIVAFCLMIVLLASGLFVMFEQPTTDQESIFPPPPNDTAAFNLPSATPFDWPATNVENIPEAELEQATTPTETSTAIATVTSTSTPSSTPPATSTATTTATPLPSATATQAQVVIATPQILMLQTVNVRQGPGTNYPIVTIAAQETVLPVIAQHEADNGLWYIVQLPNGEQGWISSRVSQPEDPAPFAEVPPVATIPVVPLPTRTLATPTLENAAAAEDTSSSLIPPPIPGE